MKDLATDYRTELNVVHRANSGMQCVAREIIFHGHTVDTLIQTQFTFDAGDVEDAESQETSSRRHMSKLMPTAPLLSEMLQEAFSMPLFGQEDQAAAAIFERLGASFVVLNGPVASLQSIAEGVRDWVIEYFNGVCTQKELLDVKINGFFIITLETSGELTRSMGGIDNDAQ